MAIPTIYHDTRRKTKEGTYPIKIRVTHLGKRKYYSTGKYLTKEKYLDVFKSDKSVKGSNLDIKKIVEGKLDNARSLIAAMDDFNFQSFESNFGNKLIQGKYTLESGYELHIDKKNLRFATRDTYKNSLGAIKGFCEHKGRSWKTLKYGDVTVKFLSQFENWMEDNEKKVSTRSIYLRCLRAVFNTAIDQKVISNDIYPFGKKKYQIKESENKKRPLTMDDINLIYNYNGTPSQNYYRDLFMFSYSCGGVNLTDIARMKHNQIKDGVWRFVRRKTSTTRKKQPTIEIHLTDIAKDIINQHGSKDNPNDYVFPILRKIDKDDDMRTRRIKNVNSCLNRSLKRIANKIEIQNDVSFMFGRHSFSTISRDAGTDIHWISKTLGHANLNTTQNYLGQFPKEDMKKNIEAIQPERKIQLHKVG